MSHASGTSLISILNMDNLFEGGLKTEYGLYAISSLVKANQNNDVNDAIDILDDLSKINFRKLNDKNNTQQRNEGIIIDVMYEVANEAIKHYPEKIDKLDRIMSRTEENNEIDVDKNLSSRKEFMQNLFKVTEKRMSEELKNRRMREELQDRIKANKEAILKRRAEEQAAKDRFVENKDKKFYTFDDLEFNEYKEAHLELDNGLDVVVLALGCESPIYSIKIVSDGYRIMTDLHELYGEKTSFSLLVEENKNVDEVLKCAQLLDADGKFCDPHVISGVVVADKIADGIRSGIVAEPVDNKKGRMLAENVKMKYLQQRKQKG